MKSDRDQNVTENIGRNRKGQENTGRDGIREASENKGKCLQMQAGGRTAALLNFGLTNL
jgi:hypothetical protein